jgi:hypothetical protein
VSDPRLDADQAENAQDAGPLPLRLAVLLLWAEAAAMLGLAVAEAVRTLVGGSDDLTLAVWVVGGPILAAIVLWQAGRLLVNRRLSGQGLGIGVQLTATPVVFAMITGDGEPWVHVLGAVIAVVAVAVGALLVAPSSRAALIR